MNMHHDPFDDLQPIRLERNADDCLFHWNLVIKAATDEWAKNFAKSIANQSRRRGWKPTPKQLALMRSMVSALFTHGDDDLSLIE
jgi:hypothetical protein